MCVVGVRSGGMGRVQPLHDDGERQHAFRALSNLQGLPAVAGFAVFQAGVPSRSPAEKNEPRGLPIILSES